jgi:prepilin peptidase CpaA
LTLIGATVLLVAAVHDVIARTIPNWLALGLALLGIAQRAVTTSIPGGLLAGFLIFGLAALCWRRGWLGGGDVKLLGAASMMVAPSNVPAFICAVALAGGILALLYLFVRRFIVAESPSRPRGGFRRKAFVMRALHVERWRIQRGGPLPYACAIATGFVLVSL